MMPGRPRIAISFDTDHVDDARMAEFLESHPLPGRGTFFCTERYPALEATRHELAPHPFLSEGGGPAWDVELDAKRREFPEAVGWRSHACVFSHSLAVWLGRNGYRYASCQDEFGKPGLAASRLAWGVWNMPIYYMDTLDTSRRRFWGPSADAPFSSRLIDIATEVPGDYVFDFHPIHVLLNTPDPAFYLAARDRFRSGAPIAELRHPGDGVATFFTELCRRMRRLGMESVPIADMVPND
jgi:hypothetical protein